MNNRKVVVEAEPFKKYDERKYCVLVWFMSYFDAKNYRPEFKYMEKFELLEKVMGDNTKNDYPHYRVYQIRPKYV